MKISCQSCQAKYTIADEKVLGKIVKIRCKKCGATIVINGNEAEAATHTEGAQPQQGAGAGVYDYSSQTGGESWTVNVADGDQRTMTTAEIVATFRQGLINEETFCWKDGMADWLPVRDVPEIMGALGAPSFHAEAPPEDATQVHQPAAAPAPAPAPAPAAQPQPGFSSLFGGGGNAGQNGGAPLFGGGAEPAAAAPAPTAAARRAGGRGGGGADLFGSAAAAGGEEDVMTSASSSPQMAPGGDKRVGERNENSVLFSLNALTESAPKQETPMAQGEGSGLIDIRALSSSMKDESKSNNKVDDIMNLSGGGAFSAALAAPVLAPPPADMQEQAGQQQKKGGAGLIIGIVAGFAVLGLIVVAALFVLRKPTDITAPNPSAMAMTASAAPNTSAGGTTAPTDTGSAAPATSLATGPTTSASKPGVGVSGTGAKPPTGVTATGGGNPPPGGGTTAVVTPTGGGGGRCNCAASDFNCKMAEGAGAPCPGAGGTKPPDTSGGGGAAFDRGAAGGALGGIAGNLSSCKKADGPTGSGHVKVTFQPNGTVSAVEVDQAPFSGTAVGGCVAGKFRSAKVPAFSGAPVTVGKTFALN